MKTAISLLDELYRKASAAAEQLGIPRSQLFARGVEDYFEHHSYEVVKARIGSLSEPVVAR